MKGLSREAFTAMTNTLGIAGMTQEELDELLECNTEEGTVFEVKVCPVCGKPYLTRAVCRNCGAEPSEFLGNDVEDYRNWYDQKIKENPDYIWGVTE